LNDAFNDRVKAAQRSDNTGGLDGHTANEVYRNFREARQIKKKEYEEELEE